MIDDTNESMITIEYICTDDVYPAMKISSTNIEYNFSVDYILFCISMYVVVTGSTRKIWNGYIKRAS